MAKKKATNKRKMTTKIETVKKRKGFEQHNYVLVKHDDDSKFVGCGGIVSSVGRLVHVTVAHPEGHFERSYLRSQLKKLK